MTTHRSSRASRQPPDSGRKADSAPYRDGAWALLLALVEARRSRRFPTAPTGFYLGPDGALLAVAPGDPQASLTWDGERLRSGPGHDSAIADLIDLYTPLFPRESERPVVIGHLGQSIDAKIATHSGDSHFVTGPENIVHLHRMRALSDAVVVGAGTVAADNPRLTTRLVHGSNPVRVVIDPERRLPPGLRFATDGEAPTVIVCAADRMPECAGHPGLIGIARGGDGLVLSELVSALVRRGLRCLFIEGGGVTVSRWLSAGLLDRLHIAVAPVLVGDGRPSLMLPPAPNIASCPRPPARVFQLGADILWDFDLRDTEPGPGPAPALRRVY